MRHLVRRVYTCVRAPGDGELDRGPQDQRELLLQRALDCAQFILVAVLRLASPPMKIRTIVGKV